MTRLLLASNNTGKAAEYRHLLVRLSYELVTPTDIGLDIAVAENGDSFEENAVLKATIYASISGILTIADDSGLEVDALGGEPGIYSARYGGKNNDAGRNEYLLTRLRDVPPNKRQARFRCVIALASHMGLIGSVSGDCEGIITTEPRGEHGFGYDPIFLVPELGKTMAELPMKDKNRLSHRARAAAKLKVLLKRSK